MASFDRQFHRHFTVFCQKVLPLVYDESISYYEMVCKLTDFIHKMGLSLDDILKRLDALEDITAEWPKFQQQINDTLKAYEADWGEWQTDHEAKWKAWADAQTAAWNLYQTIVNGRLEDMEALLDDIKSGKYVDLYVDSIKNYIDDNLKNFVAEIVTFVTFGLTNDGHFAAYIPETWRFLTFSTITDPNSPLYNHLVLTY